MPLRRTDPRFVWDEEAQRYRSKATGRLVQNAAILRGLEQALAVEEQRARELAGQMQRGEVTPALFQREMEKVVANTQYYSAAAALGGWDAMTTGDAQFVERRIDDQLSWLKALTKDIRAGLPLDGRFFNRVGQYAKAGRATYFTLDPESKFAAGKTRVRNVLHPADHCTGPGSCLEQTELGWMGIGDPRFIPPGERLCRGSCLCTLEYDDKDVGPSPEGQAAVKRVTEAETDAAIIARPTSAYPAPQPGAKDTYNPDGSGRYQNPDGSLTPERRRLWDALIRKTFAETTATPVEHPTVYVMGGGPASGKSSMGDDPENTFKVDPDKFKIQFPDFGEAVKAGRLDAAAYVHEESSQLAKEVVAEGIKRGYNVIIDGTGDNFYEKLAGKVAQYRAGGGERVVANYVTLDFDDAVDRMIGRAQKPGPNFQRYVNLSYMKETYMHIAEIIPRAVKEGLFDEFTLFDNNVALGQPARIIAHYADGKLDILDQAAWDRAVNIADDLAKRPTPVLEDLLRAKGILPITEQSTADLESRTGTGKGSRGPKAATASTTGAPLFDHDPHWEPPPVVLRPEDAPRSEPLVGDDRAAEFSRPLKPVSQVGTDAERRDLAANLREIAGIIDKAKAAGLPVENPIAMNDIREDGFVPGAITPETSALNPPRPRQLTASELKLIDNYFAARSDLQTIVAQWSRKILNETLPADMPKPRALDWTRLDDGTGGETDPVAKDVRLNRQMLPDFANLLAGVRTAREWGALQTLIHEEFHVASPMVSPFEYMQRNGGPVEELLTEAASRRATDAMFGVGVPADRHQFGGYRDAERAIEELERVRPGTIDRAWSKTTTDARSLVISDAVGDWLTKDALPVITSTIGDAPAPATPKLVSGLAAILAEPPTERPLATTNDLVELWWKTMPKVFDRLDELKAAQDEIAKLNALDEDKLTGDQREQLRHYRAIADAISASFLRTLNL